MATRPVQISLAHKGGSLIRASVSEDMRGDQLLRAIARRLVEAGFEKGPLVKALQKFHFLKCTCVGEKLTGSLEGELVEECLQESKIGLKDFAEFAAFKDAATAKAEASAEAEEKSRAASAKAAKAKAKGKKGAADEVALQIAAEDADAAAIAAAEAAAAAVNLGYIDIRFAKAQFAKRAKKVGSDEWTIHILGGKADEPNRANRFIAVTLLSCELGGSDAELVLSCATPGELFRIACNNGVLVNDVMTQIHKERGFDEGVAVKLLTKDGALLEPGDAFNASRLTAEVHDMVPRLKIKAVLGLACSNDPDEDRLRDSFATWDLDGNGEISASEMVDILTKLDPRLDATAIYAMVAQADVNKNGVLDYDEFVTWLMK